MFTLTLALSLRERGLPRAAPLDSCLRRNDKWAVAPFYWGRVIGIIGHYD